MHEVHLLSGVVSTLAPFFRKLSKKKILLWVEESPLIWFGIVHVWKRNFVWKESKKAANIGLRRKNMRKLADMQEKADFHSGEILSDQC